VTPLSNIGCKRFSASTVNFTLKGGTKTVQEIWHKRVGACCEIWRIRQGQDILIASFRKSVNISEFRIFELLGKQLQVVLTASLIARECLPEAFNRAGLGRMVLEKITHL